MMEKILIVDDDVNLCEALSEELKEVGYTVNHVNNADDSFKFIEERSKPDLLLLDLKMPGKDGFYVLNKIAAQNINVKVIVLTAYADVKSAIDSAKMGASDFVSKPYDLDELIITIRKVLQKEENEN